MTALLATDGQVTEETLAALERWCEAGRRLIEQIVGVGDAENDLVFLTQCGYAVAVNNALPTVKQQVDWVTKGDRGTGVIELIHKLLN